MYEKISKNLKDFIFRHSLSKSDRYNFPISDAKFYAKSFIKAQSKIINNGQIILGKGVSEFESSFANWIGKNIKSNQVLGVANGTDALELALRGINITSGDHVAIPSHTAYATAAAILRIGAKPIFVDIDQSNFTISPTSLKKILEMDLKIKAVIAVHLYGGACEIKKISEICNNFNIPLIEDCAQACGTRFLNKTVGTFGHLATFSFYPTKNLSALGDGGALLINKSKLDLNIFRRLRTYGWDSNRDAIQFGINSRLDEVQALLLSSKLKDLEKRIQQRRKLAHLYNKLLNPFIGNSSLLSIPKTDKDIFHSYHLYVIRVDQKKRSKIKDFCLKSGIPVSIHYPKAIHQNQFLLNKKLVLTNTEQIVKEILTLPLSPYMRHSDVFNVVKCLKKII